MKTKLIIFVKLVLIASFGFYYGHSLEQNFLQLPSIKYIEHIIEASRSTGVNPALIAAIVAVESNFNPKARSYAGAKGLMQINGVTARYLKIKNLYDPKTNIAAGVGYLSQLSEMFNGDVNLMLAAYNAGPGAVKKFGGIPPYKETRNYVKKVLELFHFYKAHPDLSQYF